MKSTMLSMCSLFRPSIHIIKLKRRHFSFTGFVSLEVKESTQEKIHWSSVKPTLPCPICSRRFRDEGVLNTHIGFNHSRMISDALRQNPIESYKNIFGEEEIKSITNKEMRYSNGLVITLTGEFQGYWYSFIGNEGGGPLRALKFKEDLSVAQAAIRGLELLRSLDTTIGQQLFKRPKAPNLSLEERNAAHKKLQKLKIDVAQNIWATSVDLKGSVGEKYLVKHRKIDKKFIDRLDFRFLPKGAVYKDYKFESTMYADVCTMVKPFGYKIRDVLSESQCSRQLAYFFALCLSYFVGTDRKNVGQIDGQPPIVRQAKKIRSGGLAPKLGLGIFAACYTLLYTFLGGQLAVAYVHDFKNRPHHVIFDNLGQMSTGVTYINIAIPLNISIIFEQIELFDKYLDTLLQFDVNIKPSTTSKDRVQPNAGLYDKYKMDQVTTHNMEQLTKQLVSYAKKRLTFLSSELQSLDNLLPADPSFDKNNERHKRFVFMIPMIICEVNKGFWKGAHSEAVNKIDEIQKELELYKQEYARLYDETLPELIPEYIEDNHDAMDEDTLEVHVDYLTRTKRDVQFLMNIIQSKNTSHTTTKPIPRLQPTTPNPFRNFSNLYTNHKKQPLSSTFMKPGTTSQQHKEQLIQGRGTLQTPLKRNTNNNTKVFTHREIVDFDTPYPIRNRTKRFLPAAALAVGALGTFLGIFNTVEIDNLRRQIGTMSNNQNLLIQVTKIHTEQIVTLENSILQLNDIFNLYLKNNPALLYAKLEDVLQSLTDKIQDLKSTVQMLHLQRLSTNTLSSLRLISLYDQVSALAKANNLQTLTNKPQDLFQLDTSYIRIQNEILVLVHVPCSNPSSMLTIYKYVPFPIPVLPLFNPNISKLNTIQDVFDISSPIADIATEGIHFQPDADLIAIGKNDKGRHRYILLSSAEMSACTKRSNAYMCEKHQVTKSDLLGSCLGSLYLQSPLGVAINCDVNRIPLKETVYQISNTNHIVFTPYPITTQISCHNGSYFPLKIKHTQQIRIPEGCLVELTNHTITSDFSIRISSDSIHFEWDFDPISLPNSAKLMMDSVSIDSKLKFLRNSIEKVQMGDIHAQGFENLMVDHVSSGSWLGTTFIVCFVITGILTILTAVICTRNYLLAKGWIGTRSRSQHHPREFNVGYHRNNRDIFDDGDEELSRIVRRPSSCRTGTQSTAASRETPPPFIHLVNPTAPEL